MGTKQKIVMLWNKDHTASANCTKIRDIVIYDRTHHPHLYPKPCWVVYGWYNQSDYFDFGQFDTEYEARQFVDALHLEIKNG